MQNFQNATVLYPFYYDIYKFIEWIMSTKYLHKLQYPRHHTDSYWGPPPGEHVFVPVALRPEGGHHLPADVVGGEAAEVQVRHGHGARVAEPAATRGTWHVACNTGPWHGTCSPPSPPRSERSLAWPRTGPQQPAASACTGNIRGTGSSSRPCYARGPRPRRCGPPSSAWQWRPWRGGWWSCATAGDWWRAGRGSRRGGDPWSCGSCSWAITTLQHFYISLL